MSRWGWIVGMSGYGWCQMVLWYHGWGYKNLQTASHIHIICIKHDLAPWYAVNGLKGAPLHCYNICAGGGEFCEVVAWARGQMVLWCLYWGARGPRLHISTFYIYILIAIHSPTAWKVRSKKMEKGKVRVGWFAKPEVGSRKCSKNKVRRRKFWDNSNFDEVQVS